MKRFNQIARKIPYKQKSLPLRKNGKGWWTPIWKGLATDTRGKHRKAMGASLWTYLYLLTYTNRKNGIFNRKQETIAKETGLPLRTIQRHLKRLAAREYITLLKPQTYPQIRIEKWKLFNHSTPDES
jgi:DNA-binding transcriptional ArsR family regulator